MVYFMICVPCLKLPKAPKFLICKVEETETNSLTVTVCNSMFSANAVSIAINFKTITIAYSVSTLAVSFVLLLCLFAALFYWPLLLSFLLVVVKQVRKSETQ